MDKIKNPVGRVLIHLALVLFAVYSLVPFYWTTMQSFKTLRDANARTPKFFFTPTWENYQELWLRSVPENGALIAFFLLLAVVILICALLFAEYLPAPKGVIYACVAAGFVGLLWAIPRLVDTAKFYDYFINTLIVTVGTVVVSISIGCLAGYGLARYAGMAGVVILIAALGMLAMHYGYLRAVPAKPLDR